jgi:hypothetical protein
MTIRSIAKEQRQAYFDQVSRELGATEAQIEIGGGLIGSQRATDWVTLMGLSYDPRSDTMEINVENVDHWVTHPREVYVDDDIDGLRSIEIIDTDDNRQIIRLRQPLRLPH